MASSKPIDLDHLALYTGGDSALNAEILALFDGQCRTILTQLQELTASDDNSKAWRELSHKLKGAARGVGAFAVGDAAADAEKVMPTAGHAILEQLKRDSAAVHDFIAEVLAKTV